MLKYKINIRFIDKSQKPTTISWSVQNYDHVEGLVQDVLEYLKVGPVYRTLFGLKSTREELLWFAPNVKVEDLLKSIGKANEVPTFDLRMRYRPTSFTKLIASDTHAFEIIFAQVRYDFFHTKFSDEKSNFVLWNDYVLGLVATDLLRYALEHDIDINEICERVSKKDFVPHQAAVWQRPILFLLREKLNIQQQILNGYNNCDDILKIKQGFIELFLYEVSKDYGAETYKVTCVDNPNCPQRMLLRVRFNQSAKDAVCEIESCPTRRGASVTWTKLCDIYSICYGTLRNEIVEINRSNGRPFRVSFESPLHAKSFLSLVDGYYRLMRKWYFNFCRDVSSPDLDYLRSIRSHGPIGFESMRRKLTKHKKPGTFLVRQCMEKNNRYIIDVLLQTKARLAIDIDFDPRKKVFTKVSHDVGSSRAVVVSTKLDREEYTSLKALVNDMQINVEDSEISSPLLQLKYWLPPGEYDDCPALLLSLPKKKFAEFDLRSEGRIHGSIAELPRFIPANMLKFSNKLLRRSNNKMFVRLASLNSEQFVIVKELMENPDGSTEGELGHNDLVFNFCQGVHGHSFKNLKPAQLRLVDWVFVKNSYFAETFGIDLTRNSLIQEYFPLGRLDRFLNKASGVTDLAQRSIARQLGQALLFLQEKRIVHGKIRCHNIYLKSLEPVHIKITDPLGTIDVEKDMAFIPPEYLGIKGELYLREYQPGIDVWSTGTTLWQIFNQGRMPPAGRYANTLFQPPKCPNYIWSLIESCWSVDAGSRAAPQTIFRDLNDYFAWGTETHAYDYITNYQVASTANSMTNVSLSTKASTELVSSSSIRSERIASENGSQMYLLNTSLEVSRNRSENVTLVKAPSTKSLTLRNPISRGWKSIKLFKNSSTYNNKKIDMNQEYKCLSTWSSVSTCSSPSTSELLEPIADNDNKTPANCPVWQITPDKLKMSAEIGRGSCGIVMKGVLKQWGGLSEQVVAVKCINNHELDDTSRVEDLRREFEILKKLNHGNIVKTLGYVDDGNMKLIMEYMPLGSLLSCLRNSHHEHLMSLPLKKYAHDIAEGMNYLESMKVVHRDLALRNILVKDKNEVKICDFGLAHFLGANSHYKLKTDRALPLRWYAPEALETWTFSHKTDVWSYGIVLWEIYSGGSSPQYSGAFSDLAETLKYERLAMPKDCPAPIYNIMLACWAYLPEDRESFSRICERLEGLPETSSAMYQSRTQEKDTQ